MDNANSEPIDPAIREQMRALCTKMGIAHGLDDDIQQELYGHMEDKLLGYLSGDERVTEQDALILMREHFGKPGLVKRLLSDVHTKKVYSSLSKRLALLVVVSALIGTFAKLLSPILFASGLLFFPASAYPSELPLLYSLMISTARAILVTGIFVHVARTLRNGSPIWLARFSTRKLVAIAAAIFLIGGMAPYVGVHTYLKFQQYGFEFSALVTVFWFLSGCTTFVFAMVWIWFCDQPPRRLRQVAIAGTVFVLFHVLPIYVLPSLMVTFDNPDSLITAHVPTFVVATGTWPAPWNMHLLWAVPILDTTANTLAIAAGQIAMSAVPASLAIFLYLGFQRARKYVKHARLT